VGRGRNAVEKRGYRVVSKRTGGGELTEVPRNCKLKEGVTGGKEIRRVEARTGWVEKKILDRERVGRNPTKKDCLLFAALLRALIGGCLGGRVKKDS